MVHHDGPHTNEDIIIDVAAMDNGPVAYGHIITDDGIRFFISAVDNGPILDIDLIANANGIDVSTDHRVKPETAIVPGDHISNYDGMIRHKVVCAQLWGEASYSSNRSHQPRIRA